VPIHHCGWRILARQSQVGKGAPDGRAVEQPHAEAPAVDRDQLTRYDLSILFQPAPIANLRAHLRWACAENALQFASLAPHRGAVYHHADASALQRMDGADLAAARYDDEVTNGQRHRCLSTRTDGHACRQSVE